MFSAVKRAIFKVNKYYKNNMDSLRKCGFCLSIFGVILNLQDFNMLMPILRVEIVEFCIISYFPKKFKACTRSALACMFIFF